MRASIKYHLRPYWKKNIYIYIVGGIGQNNDTNFPYRIYTLYFYFFAIEEWGEREENERRSVKTPSSPFFSQLFFPIPWSRTPIRLRARDRRTATVSLNIAKFNAGRRKVSHFSFYSYNFGHSDKRPSRPSLHYMYWSFLVFRVASRWSIFRRFVMPRLHICCCPSTLIRSLKYFDINYNIFHFLIYG